MNWDLAEFDKLIEAYGGFVETAGTIVRTANDAPSSAVYGLAVNFITAGLLGFTNGAAVGMTSEVQRTMSVTQAAVVATRTAYDNTETTNAEKAREVDQIIDELDQEIPG